MSGAFECCGNFQCSQPSPCSVQRRWSTCFTVEKFGLHSSPERFDHEKWNVLPLPIHQQSPRTIRCRGIHWSVLQPETSSQQHRISHTQWETPKISVHPGGGLKPEKTKTRICPETLTQSIWKNVRNGRNRGLRKEFNPSTKLRVVPCASFSPGESLT